MFFICVVSFCFVEKNVGKVGEAKWKLIKFNFNEQSTNVECKELFMVRFIFQANKCHTHIILHLFHVLIVFSATRKDQKNMWKKFGEINVQNWLGNKQFLCENIEHIEKSI